jgi:Na+-transporting NADH:ubiquinone oxidoreductase subunit NqrC
MEKDPKTNKKILFIVLAVILVIALIVFIVIKNNANRIQKAIDDIPVLLIDMADIYYDVYPSAENNDLDDPKNADTIAEVKKITNKAFEIVDSPNPYCGKNPDYLTTINKGDFVYYLSTEFKKYKELKQSFEEYVYPDIITLNQENYLEKGGKLYCLKHSDKETEKPKSIDYRYAIVENDRILADMMLKYEEREMGYLSEYVKKDGKWLLRFYSIG